MIRKEAWPFYRTSSGVRLCWVSKNLKDLKNGVVAARGRGEVLQASAGEKPAAGREKRSKS